MQVEVRIVGDRRAVVEAREVDAPATPTPSLRELLTHVVRAEVADFADREQQRRFVRALTAEQIAAGVVVGKVDAGGRAPTGPVDPDVAVATALEAFTDRLFLVLVDDAQVEDLDAPVSVRDDTRLRFLRLTPLAGG